MPASAVARMILNPGFKKGEDCLKIRGAFWPLEDMALSLLLFNEEEYDLGVKSLEYIYHLPQSRCSSNDHSVLIMLFEIIQTDTGDGNGNSL